MSAVRTGDLRYYAGTGQILNSSRPNLPTILGYAAPAGAGWAWITLADHTAQAGTADTLQRAMDEVLDTWIRDTLAVAS